MSIETLLEAAKFLEFQAQQQQKARGKFVFYWGKKDKINKSSLVFHTDSQEWEPVHPFSERFSLRGKRKPCLWLIYQHSV